MRKLAMVAAAACMWSQTALADWVKAETDNFIVYSELKKDEVTNFLNGLEQYRNYLTKITVQVPPEDTLKLTIFVAKNDRKYHNMVGLEGTAGVYTTGPLGPSAALYFDDAGGTRGRKGSIKRLKKQPLWQTGEQVLYHEFVHFMQRMGTPAYYPLWYSEGFAEFISSVHFTEDKMFFGKVLIGRAASLDAHYRWVSAKELLERRQYGFKGGVFYAQAWLLTHMLFLDKDFQRGVGDFIKLLQHEVNPEEALKHVYNIGYDELDKAMHEYYRKNEYGILGLPLDKSLKPKINIQKLSDEEQALVEYEATLRFPYNEDNLKSVAKKAEKGKVGAKNTFAFVRAEVRAKAYNEEWDEAFQLAEAYLAENPNSDNAKTLLGKLLVGSEIYALDEAEEKAREEAEDKKEETDTDDAEKEPVYVMDKAKLERAVGLLSETAEQNLSDPETFVLLSRALSELGKSTRENAKYIEHAYAIYPQSPEIRRQYGDYLVETDDFELACQVLRPVYHTSYDLDEVKELRKIILEFPNSEEACPLGGLRPMEVEDMEKNADK